MKAKISYRLKHQLIVQAEFDEMFPSEKIITREFINKELLRYLAEGGTIKKLPPSNENNEFGACSFKLSSTDDSNYQ